MSCAEVAMTKAMIKKYKHDTSFKLKKGVVLCILENGCLGVDFDSTLNKKEVDKIKWELAFVGCGSDWDAPCSGNCIGT